MALATGFEEAPQRCQDPKEMRALHTDGKCGKTDVHHRRSVIIDLKHGFILRAATGVTSEHVIHNADRQHGMDSVNDKMFPDR